MRRGTAGAVSVEAALALGLVLLPLFLGVVDLGQGIIVRMRLDRATEAALFEAWGVPGASAAAVQAAAQAGYGTAVPALTADASFACYCIAPAGTRQSGTAVSCTGNCAAGQSLGEWLTTHLSAALALAFPVPFLGSTLNLTATATARVQ